MSRSTFFISVEIFKIETFQSRLWRVKIFVEICRDAVEICQDLSRNLNIVEAFWVWKWWKVSTDREILTRKYKNPRTSRSRQTVEKCRNFQISTKFSISIEIFWSGRWCRDKIEISRSSRLTFWRCRDFLNCRDSLFDNVEIESLDQDHVETNRDPQAYILLFRYSYAVQFCH